VHDSTSLGNRPPEMVKATVRIRNAAGKVVFTGASKVFHLPAGGADDIRSVRPG
jgi:hypothetical protein